MVKQTPEEIRREVLEEDAKKDVSIQMSIAIGVVSSISCVAGISALIMMRALVYFRQGVDVHWLTCVPFLFPSITGLFAAYKKQFGLLGAHMTVTILALLVGGFGFGISVDPIFINRHLCQPVNPKVACDKYILSFLYVLSGGLASVFTVIGFLLTISALYSATKRIAKREYEAHQQHLREQQEMQNEMRNLKMTRELRTSLSMSYSAPVFPSMVVTANGTTQQGRTEQLPNKREW